MAARQQRPFALSSPPPHSRPTIVLAVRVGQVQTRRKGWGLPGLGGSFLSRDPEMAPVEAAATGRGGTGRPVEAAKETPALAEPGLIRAWPNPARPGPERPRRAG